MHLKTQFIGRIVVMIAAVAAATLPVVAVAIAVVVAIVVIVVVVVVMAAGSTKLNEVYRLAAIYETATQAPYPDIQVTVADGRIIRS